MKKMLFQDFICRAKKLYGDKYNYSRVNFINTSIKICVICPEHGEFWITPHNFLNGHKCPACSGLQRITKDVFISRSNEIHHNKYDYSKVEIKGANNKVCIICPEHGEFWQKAIYHYRGYGCPVCGGNLRLTTEEFIKKAKEIHGNEYDYSKAECKGNKEKVCIICSKHGEFWQSPNNHLRGARCPGCFGTPKYTNEEFIKKALLVHNEKYVYSKVKYDGLQKKVCIICPQHGEFWQRAGIHLKGSRCPKCSGTEKITLPLFIERCTKTHNNKYDYSHVKFDNLFDFVKIICPIHGEYEQRAVVHYRGYGCPACGGSKRLSNDEFIKKAQKVHNNKYDYSKINYINTATKTCIVCPQHGEFWQTPNNHLFGAGCPVCPQSNLEGEIRHFLEKNEIKFEQEKTFDWLVFKKKIFLDFFLPEYSVAIECQGRQHFIPSELFGGDDFFNLTIERDNAKKELCEKHGVRILYYSNAHIDYPYPVFESLKLLLKAIKQRGKMEPQLWKDQLELIFD